ncbi:MAG: putative dehydrogenase [Candidatus Promineifilaceae bacterium]
MKKDYRIGILGSGFIISECHLVSYQKEGYHPVAIASRTKANAEQAAERFGIETVHEDYDALLDDTSIEVLDIAVPPMMQPALIRAACERGTVRAILAQKPLALSLAEGRSLVETCERAGILLAVNQNMRHDPSVKAGKALLASGQLGDPVFATIDMRGIPHWQPWQEAIGGASLKIMSIHHLDCMRYWFGEPERLFCSMRPDPRTTFAHADGICTYVLEYASGLRAVIVDDVWTGPAQEGCPGDIRIEWRVEGMDGLAIGDIGWCKDPYTSPSTLRHASKGDDDFVRPDLKGAWFPDAFGGTMGDVFRALETGEPCALSARDNLGTLALIEAAQLSVHEHRAVKISEIGLPI